MASYALLVSQSYGTIENKNCCLTRVRTARLRPELTYLIVQFIAQSPEQLKCAATFEEMGATPQQVAKNRE